jgi:UDP-N-acetylglucosamine/UDP-N-acetylgalactosamine diphosphorylase
MAQVPEDLTRILRDFGQEHVLAWWDRLSDAERTDLVEQLRGIDLQQLARLYNNRDKTFRLPSDDEIQPIPVKRLDPDDLKTRQLGEQALKNGEVAVLVVAGGQGSRLGFDHPKGMFPIGPVTNKSLFQIHAEKVLALSRRFRVEIPFLVMTSSATHAETVQFFSEKSLFGLPPSEVYFFSQGNMPALDMSSGKLLMHSRGRLFTSPNGHGGTLTALADSGLLDRLRDRGVRQVVYFQVDNPLVKVADPLFLGHHAAMNAEASSKVVPKESPADKLGNMVLVNRRCTIIEYSDLPEKLAQMKDRNSNLRFAFGSPAIHIFSIDFLRRVTRGDSRIPFHIAHKKVPYIDANGQLVQPAKENALKFELFIFDVLPLADRWTVVETQRREEFVPLKNANGPDSPAAVRQAISDVAGDWLEKAGVKIPRTPDGTVAVPLEISPVYALDAAELASKVDRNLKVTGPLYLDDTPSAYDARTSTQLSTER